jgi:hypothetical protein
VKRLIRIRINKNLHKDIIMSDDVVKSKNNVEMDCRRKEEYTWWYV